MISPIKMELEREPVFHPTAFGDRMGLSPVSAISS